MANTWYPRSRRRLYTTLLPCSCGSRDTPVTAIRRRARNCAAACDTGIMAVPFQDACRSAGAADVLHLFPDIRLGGLRGRVEVPDVEHHADAPHQHRDHRPEEPARTGEEPDADQREVDRHVGDDVALQVALPAQPGDRRLA